MNDNTYRLCKVTLMGIFVLGALFIGYRASQTGRYVQYDVRKTCTQDGRSRFLQDYVIDTWSGAHGSKRMIRTNLVSFCCGRPESNQVILRRSEESGRNLPHARSFATLRMTKMRVL